MSGNKIDKGKWYHKLHQLQKKVFSGDMRPVILARIKKIRELLRHKK